MRGKNAMSEAKMTQTPRTDAVLDQVGKNNTLHNLWVYHARKLETELAVAQAANAKLVADIMGMQDGSLLRDTQRELSAALERARAAEENLKAYVAQAGRVEWQPIETAPKGGKLR